MSLNDIDFVAHCVIFVGGATVLLGLALVGVVAAVMSLRQ